MIPKNNFLRTAQLLVDEGKNEKAIKLLDHCQEVFPNSKIPFDMYMLPFAEVYYKAGAAVKGSDIASKLADIFEANIKYYSSLKPKFASYYQKDREQAVMVLRRLEQLAKEYKQDELSKRLGAYFAANPQLEN